VTSSQLRWERWLGLEIRHLAALRAIAEERSFRKAAARLGYTQPAISHQLASFERIVGRQLVLRPRGPQPLALTDAGRLLMEHAVAIEGHLDAARADLVALNGRASSVSVGFHQSVASHVLPRVLERFASEFPEFGITLIDCRDETDLLALIECDELDLGLTGLPIPPGPFETERLLEDDYVLVVPASSPLAHRSGRCGADDIARLPLGTFKNNRSTEDLLEHLQAEEFGARVAFASDDCAVLQAVVAAGFGAALIPRLAADEASSELATLELPPGLPTWTLALVRNRQRHPIPAADAFIETARALCAKVAGTAQ
jgi:DNA-binding transcriptional LysR family regulator